MQTDIGHLLTSAGFFYHEIGVIERLGQHLSLEKESPHSLGRRLLYLAEAAKEWCDNEESLFLTFLSFDHDCLWVVTRMGYRIANFKLDIVKASR